MKTDYDPSNALATYYEKAFQKYLSLEEEYIPSPGYENSKEAVLRRKAIRVILESSECRNFDAFVPYLALNYFDRFISRNPLTRLQGTVRKEVALLANCCLMLAWKTRHSNFNVLEFLAKTNMFEHHWNILPMQLEIICGLDWKMRSVTAIGFIDMFVQVFPVANQISRRFVNEIIIQAQGDINFTRFKPSAIAAAALLAACKLEYRELLEACQEFISKRKFVKEDDLNACCDRICEMCLEMQIVMGRYEREAQVEGTSQAGESSSSTSQRPGKETVQGTSEIEEIGDVVKNQRPDNEPIQQFTVFPEEERLVPESENNQQMDFKLKWILWNTDEKTTIDSPLFRQVAEAAETQITSADADADPGDTNAPASCCPSPLPCTGCNNM